MRRISHIFIVFLLLVSSGVDGTVAFQLQKGSVIAAPSKPATAIALPTKRLKPVNSRTTVSSRIRFPKRERPSKQPKISKYLFGAKSRSIIISHQTTTSAKGGSVNLTLDIGAPAISRSTVAVKNAPAGMTFSRVNWQSLSGALPNGLILLPAHGGAEEIPILNITFAIPDGAKDITPDVTILSSTPLGNIHLPPSPKMIGKDLQRVFDSKAFSNPIAVTLGNPRTFRSLRSVTLSIPLINSNGSAKSAIRKFSVAIKFAGGNPVPSGSTSDPLFADMNTRLVANSDDVAKFAVPLRVGSSRHLPSAARSPRFSTQSVTDTTAYGWIDPNAVYVRLAVTRDGLYRVNSGDLNFSDSSFTLTKSHWTPQNLRCFNHGVEVPVWIDTDAAGNIAGIEFYGQHLRGFPLPTVQLLEPENPLPEYYNVATDTNVYWLTSSGSGPVRRYAQKSPSSSGAPAITSGTILLHHERDFNYYEGDAGSLNDYTQQVTEYVAGERFEWFEFHSPVEDTFNLHFRDTFYIAKLPTDTANLTANFKFLLRGMTSGPGTAHIFRVVINGKLPGTVGEFTDFNYDSMMVSLPLSQLVEGANSLQIEALASNSALDQYYLDYYEVTVPCALAPSIDTAIAKGQWLFKAAISGRQYRLPLIYNGDQPHLYNLTDDTRIIPLNSVYSDSTNSNSSSYAAAASASLMKCDNIQHWNTSGKDWAILNSSNKADYIVITHPDFLKTAQKLSISRFEMGLDTMVVTTDQIFNTFDYGSNEPEAIRRFLTYAYNNYSGPPVGLVTLLGEASWDPKFTNANPPSTKQCFVPSYGNPVSDYYYTLSEDSGLSKEPLMLIARIPVSSSSEAQSYLTKLSEFENKPPAEWNRHFLFIAGGLTENEHEIFDGEDTAYLYKTDSISSPPMNIHGSMIDRTDFSTQLDATLTGVITDSIQSGKAIMFFTGHGATFTSDVLLPDATLLRNKGLYPLLMTGSCRTGAFAEPSLIGVNESYIKASESGAIQAYGTTGYGEIDEDNDVATTFFQIMKNYRNTHNMTRAQTINTTQMLTSAQIYVAPYFGQDGHNSAMQYSILGDAATGFALRPQAEFAVYGNEIQAFGRLDTVAKTGFSVSDSLLTIRAPIHNYGYSSDRPVTVKFTDAGPSGLLLTQLDTLPTFDEISSASAQFAINTQSIGSHTITVFVDPDSLFPETYKPDNISSILIRVSGLSTTPFYPYEGSRQFCDIAMNKVHFIVLTPTGSMPTDQVELQLDSTEAFLHPIIDQTTPIGQSYYDTFDVALPGAPIPNSGVYWWRTRVVRSGLDTTDWEYATFSTSTAAKSEFSYTSPEQLASTINNGLSLDARGRLYIAAHDTIRYEAISHGVNDLGVASNPVSQVIINDKESPLYQITTQLGSGYAIFVFTKDGSKIDRVANIQIPFWSDSLTQDSAAYIFDTVISDVPANTRVIVLTVGQPALQNFISSVTSALRSVGSKNGMDSLDTWGSYALIGMKGDAPGTAKEAFSPRYSNGVDIYDTAFTTGNSGSAETPFTAVAKDYGTLSWTVDSVQAGGSDIAFTVLGSRRDGSGIDVLNTTNASQASSVNLSGIDPRIYDRLGVSMNFTRSSNTTRSPALSGIELQYDAAPELFFSPDTIMAMPNQTIQGSPVVAKYTVSTLTCTPADSVVVQLLRQYRGQADTPATHPPIAVLLGHSSEAFSDTIQTGNELGPVTLNAIVNPNEAINEQLLFNNSVSGQYNVTRDTMKPFGDILFLDPGTQIGRHIPDCGFVSSKTGISIQLTSSNPIRADTNSISALIQFEGTGGSATFAVSKSNPNGFLVDFKSFPPPSQLQAQLNITPTTPFTAGQWTVYAFVQDASGNIDTIEQCFTVSNVNGIQHVMNYPNPFKNKTDFTYVLMSDAPAEVKIFVYTIAGRKIRTLTPPSNHAGLNVVEWDGADERGNEVGNGTYLYRVVINGKNPDGSNVSDGVTERAVRAR